jgi:hypothetical protein
MLQNFHISRPKGRLDRHRAQGCWAGYVGIFQYTQELGITMSKNQSFLGFRRDTLPLVLVMLGVVVLGLALFTLSFYLIPKPPDVGTEQAKHLTDGDSK